MGISETIIAAIIGALATMATAIIQLIRNRAPSDGRPKPKKNRMRSVLATVALMIGCIVGGYAWSALRAVSAKEELTATMQAEFTRQFSEFAARQSQRAAAAARSRRRDRGKQRRSRRGRSARTPASLPPQRAVRGGGSGDLQRERRPDGGAVRRHSRQRRDQQGAPPGARTQERIGLGGARCRRADAGQPAHRRGDHANFR